MEWDNPLVARSLQTVKCEFCDSSYDPRSIFDHLLDTHLGVGSRPQEIRSQSSSTGASVSVRAHSRKQPRK
jgi:hypothetical protein